LPTILVIDDDGASLSNLGTILERAGYDVLPLSSIDQARHYLDESVPDLIVLEVDANKGAGWDLLRDIVRFEGPPTLIVSRRGREAEIVEALAIGAADVLPKPFRSNELIARIRARLGQPALEHPPAATQTTRRAPVVEEEPVFMPHAEEQTLLAPQSKPADGAEPADEHLPLGARLHAVRQRRRLSLVQINLETRIPVPYLQAIEEEKFRLLPRGEAAVQMIETYATYLGLDGGRALADYRAQHDVAPFKPIPSLGGAPAPRAIPVWISIVVAAALALAIGLGSLWLLASDKLPILRSNVRGLVTQPTATVTPAPTVPPTITPRPTPPAPTRTPVRAGGLPVSTPVASNTLSGSRR
jgi:CheY-like chemotaxis protein